MVRLKNEVEINSIDASVSIIEERISSNDIQVVAPQEIPVTDNANRSPNNHVKDENIVMINQ